MNDSSAILGLQAYSNALATQAAENSHPNFVSWYIESVFCLICDDSVINFAERSSFPASSSWVIWLVLAAGLSTWIWAPSTDPARGGWEKHAIWISSPSQVIDWNPRLGVEIDYRAWKEWLSWSNTSNKRQCRKTEDFLTSKCTSSCCHTNNYFDKEGSETGQPWIEQCSTFFSRKWATLVVKDCFFVWLKSLAVSTAKRSWYNPTIPEVHRLRSYQEGAVFDLKNREGDPPE